MNKLYEKCKSDVARKYGLGKTLVIGHLPKYYEEAAMMYAEQVNSVDLADVGGSLHAKTCKVVNDNDDEFPCDVTTCCSVGPITRENYCPNCGAKIERQ